MEKLPEHLARLKGHYRADKAKKGLQMSMDAGQKLTTVPRAPRDLSKPAQKEWRGLAKVLVELEVLTRADLRALALCCEALATVAELEDLLRTEGYTVSSAAGTHKTHPAAKLLETTRNQAHRMLADFGLNPKARKFVEKVPGKKPNQGFRRL